MGLDDSLAQKFMERLDEDHDGKLDFEEMVELGRMILTEFRDYLQQ